MLCSTLAGFVCTLCYAVDQLCASHVLTISVREIRKDKVILNQQNVLKKHDLACTLDFDVRVDLNLN